MLFGVESKNAKTKSRKRRGQTFALFLLKMKIKMANVFTAMNQVPRFPFLREDIRNNNQRYRIDYSEQ